MNIINYLEENIEYFNTISIFNGFNKSLKSIKIDNNLDLTILQKDIDYIGSVFYLPTDNNIEWRIKNIESLKIKIQKYLKKTNTTGESWLLKSAVNDLIGFRLKYIEDKDLTVNLLNKLQYNNKKFRIINLLQGKNTIDDGYRAIHIYYSMDNFHYPIEIQLWFNEDYYYNLWMHKFLYKQKQNDVLVNMFNLYKDNLINSELDFLFYLDEIENKKNIKTNWK